MLCMQPRNIHFGDQTNTGNTEFYAHNQEICTLETNKYMKYRIHNQERQKVNETV